MTKNKQGFTIVEVMIVITIIAVLASITIVAYTKVQTDSRDSQRSSRLNLIAGALEKYYQQNGEYPSCSTMTQSGSQVSTTLGGLNSTIFLTPKSTTGATNSITCTSLTSGSGPDNFAYVGDASASCTSGQTCLEFILQYRQESTGNIISLNSRHKAQVATSGTPALTATATGSTQVTLNWTSVDNAVSYKLQQATNAAFTANLIETGPSSVSATTTGLTSGTMYYFRVAAVAQSSQGSWSNTASATPIIDPPTSTPTMSATMVTTNAQGTVSAVTCTTGTAQYQIQYNSTNTPAQGAWSSWTVWSTTRTLSVAATQGYQYSFQAQARCYNGSIGSNALLTSIASTIRSINAPAAPTYLNPPYFNSYVAYNVDYASSCPAGTNIVNDTIRSRDWYGVDFGPSSSLHIIDTWLNSDGYDHNVQYWGKYQCQTTYAVSPYSPESSNTIVVHSS